MKKSVGFISLGCPKALVDSERILTQLKIDGYDIVPTYEGADVVVVNTCGFIDSAKQESLDAIGEARPHLLYISIVGVDRHPFAYYRAKWAAEQVFAAGVDAIAVIPDA